MRCPVCGEKAKKITIKGDDEILVRCGTDGDFCITPAARKRMEDVTAAVRQSALNRAILAARPGMPPTIKKFMVDDQNGRRGFGTLRRA
jgi:hypothetical protein